MSLSVDGVWRAGVWAPTVWADGVWLENAPAPRPAVFSDTLLFDQPEPERNAKPHDDDVLAILAAVMPLIAADENHEVRY